MYLSTLKKKIVIDDVNHKCVIFIKAMTYGRDIQWQVSALAEVVLYSYCDLFPTAQDAVKRSVLERVFH